MSESPSLQRRLDAQRLRNDAAIIDALEAILVRTPGPNALYTRSSLAKAAGATDALLKEVEGE